MRAMPPLMLLYDAMLRPTRFLAFLNTGWSAIGIAVATIVGALTLLMAGIISGFAQIAPLSSSGIALGLAVVIGLSPASYMMGTMLVAKQRIPVIMAFGWLRFLLVATPLCVTFMGLAYSPRFFWLQTDIWALISIMLVLGSWLGGMYPVLGTVSSYRERLAVLRWVLLGCSVSAIGAIRFSSLWSLNGLLAAATLLGFAGGVLRPLSYLWEALLSLLLTLGSWLRIPAPRLLSLHPATYDELVLIPLPGLRTLLIHACKYDLSQGCTWLLRIAQHPGQRWAAYAAIKALLRDDRLAHPLLTRLSIDDEGLRMLRRLRSISRHYRPLISAYITFGELPLPEAWPAVVAQHWGVIADARRYSHTASLAALLQLGAQVLAADRWAAAAKALQSFAAPADATSALWPILVQLQTSDYQADAIDARSLAVETQRLLQRWPGTLLAAIDEHIRFLHRIEDQRATRLHDRSN